MDENVINTLRESLPDLKITGEIKRGGQKVVYSARYGEKNKVVFKVISPSNDEEENRALREIEISSFFDSPLFAKLFDYGRNTIEDISVIYLIEEFIEGKNLRDLVGNVKPNLLPFCEIRRIISLILDALEIIEDHNLVHRDIKPENILVNEKRVVIIDFGIARRIDQKSITDSYAIFGPMTPGYAPPEQIRNEKRKISIRTDLFSLGTVFYELLTNQNPFCENVQTFNEAINNTLNYDPPKLISFGYNSTFDDFIFKCLEKNCHRRPSDIKNAKVLFNKINWGE